ncbi:MAG: hypothetical protein CBE24_02070 [bacterium TMED264]|mgnify:CR=1 FL=1|nr:MAG: hypothetical protein CBE24_02070 [bacterium TMED264]
MNFKIKLTCTLFTNLILLLLFFYLSDRTPFTGDEIGTLDISALHKPIPYKALLSFLFDNYKHTHDDIIFLRLTSYLFVFLTIVLWNFIVIKNNHELILFNFFILTSSFVLSEAIYFRYYSYYLLCSTISMIFLTNWLIVIKNYKVILSIILTLLSPYVFFILNGLQFGLFSFISIFKKINSSKTKIIIMFFMLVSFLIILVKPMIIWNLLKFFELSDHGGNFYSSFKLKGLTAAVLIKPFYAFFQMFFGYNIIPTESIMYIIAIIFIGICFLVLLYKVFRKQNELFYIYLFCFIIPFISIYYFFEAISLPGFTQLESKHGLLLFPFIILLIIRHNRLLNYKINYVFLVIIFFCHLTGLRATLKKINVNWPNIISSVSEYNNANKINILMDGRSSSTFKFYNNDESLDNKIFYTWEEDRIIDSLLNLNNSMVLLLNDYKSYTSLNIEQNWNAGKESNNRVIGLNKIIDKLNNKYIVVDSYVEYPTYAYFLVGKKRVDGTKSLGVWKHNLKDISLPITKGKRTILSSILIKPQDSLSIRYSDKLIVNLESGNSNLIDNKAVGIVISDKISFELISGENIWNLFSDYYDIKYKNENVFYSWIHRPLVSGSIKYPGSYFKHKACIFGIDLNGYNSEFIIVKNISKDQYIRVWI